MAEQDDVRLQMLLRPEWRNDAGRDGVVAALRSLSLQATGFGAATVSARASRDVFAALFDRAASEPEPAEGADQTLLVPAVLARFVQQIAIAPVHTYLHEPREGEEGGTA